MARAEVELRFANEVYTFSAETLTTVYYCSTGRAMTDLSFKNQTNMSSDIFSIMLLACLKCFYSWLKHNLPFYGLGKKKTLQAQDT